MIVSIEELGLAALFALAFANGANDAGKSVASLMMPGPSGSPPKKRKPLIWGGFFTGIGSISAILISGRLFTVFTPQSLLHTAPVSSFVLAALAGATLWILAATLLRLPVSSTHAIIGALVLLAVYLFGVSAIQWDFLLYRVVLPLAGGPIAAFVGIYIIDRLTRRTGVPGKPRPRLASIEHWASGAAVSYARGINDAPKMAALGAFFLLANPSEAAWVLYSIVALAVLLGSLVLGHRGGGDGDWQARGARSGSEVEGWGGHGSSGVSGGNPSGADVNDPGSRRIQRWDRWTRERYQILAEIDALAMVGDPACRRHTCHCSVICRSDDLAFANVLAMKPLRESVDRFCQL